MPFKTKCNSAFSCIRIYIYIYIYIFKNSHLSNHSFFRDIIEFGSESIDPFLCSLILLHFDGKYLQLSTLQPFLNLK